MIHRTKKILRRRLYHHPPLPMVLAGTGIVTVFFGIDASDEAASSEDEESDTTLLSRFLFLFLVRFGCPGPIVRCSAGTSPAARSSPNGTVVDAEVERGRHGKFKQKRKSSVEVARRHSANLTCQDSAPASASSSSLPMSLA